MPSDRTAGYDLAFVAEGVEAGMLIPRRLEIVEEMSRGVRAVVDLTSIVGDIDVAALVRHPAEVVFYARDADTIARRFAGVVTSARERARGVQGYQVVSVTIESPLAILERSADYVVHLDESTKDIVSSLLTTFGVSGVQWKAADPPKREICTQYGESMMRFASRLLEEDGVYWYVDQTDDGPKIVFGDATAHYAETSPTTNVPYREAGGMVGDECIGAILEHERLRPGKITLRDHDFKNPPLDPQLEVSETDSSPFDREHYEYPGRYTVPAEGSRRAKVRMDAFRAGASTVDVIGCVPRLSAGHWIKVQDTPAGAFDGEWVVVRVLHEWTAADDEADTAERFETRASLLPKTQLFRPLAITPKARALPCTALVRCPTGEEIHCDEFGRVRVSFMWDRHGAPDEKTSGWVRVGQMHTSGSVAIPRSGWEVFVDFEDGDPDKPVILGRLYNPKDPPPAGLPAAKTVSMLRSFSSPGGAGHNEIRTEDASAGEQICMHAQKDLNVVVANNKAKKVTTNATYSVVADESVTVGANHSMEVGAKDDVHVGGTQKWSVSAMRSKTVSGDEKYAVKGSRSVSISAVHMISTPKSDSCETPASLNETVGAVYMEAAALGTSIATAGSCNILVGGAKIEAAAAGKSDITVGARASTIGGALLNLTGKDVSTSSSAVKATTVGGAWMANAATTAELSTDAALTINVGGALIMNGTTLVMKVGGSNVTLSGGSVVVDTGGTIKLTASGPNAELAPMVGSK
jgi:type VI secretion system secreted protein VgrG